MKGSPVRVRASAFLDLQGKSAWLGVSAGSLFGTHPCKCVFQRFGQKNAHSRVALSPASSERERVEALRSLRGVEWATASVLLHLAYPERYPILDKRALHALGVRAPSAYSFRFSEAYVAACLRLAEEAGVDGRTFDQALWQWSKEQGVPLY
jgi:hypothetical protein